MIQNDAANEAIGYAQLLANEGTVAKVEDIIRHFGDRALLAPNSHAILRDRLLADITARQPFSLIRLGDGEGNTLFWGSRRDRYPELADLCMDRIWKVMFGNVRQGNDAWEILYLGMVEAISHASYLGIPTPQQARPALERLFRARDGDVDLRGTTGVIATWDWLACRAEAVILSEGNLTNWHVHNSLLRFYGDLIRAAGNISLITCYQGLLSTLKTHGGITDGAAYLIPPQAVNIRGTPHDVHFPDVFSKIDSELSTLDLTGRLFFVGAGLPGKLYCERVRRSGGMAVDVGSLMDVWMGQGVRPYQTPDFVQQHSLLKEER